MGKVFGEMSCSGMFCWVWFIWELLGFLGTSGIVPGVDISREQLEALLCRKRLEVRGMVCGAQTFLFWGGRRRGKIVWFLLVRLRSPTVVHVFRVLICQ